MTVGPCNITCMIYRLNDSTLVGATQETHMLIVNEPRWQTFPFATPNPLLSKDTQYIITMWSHRPCFLQYDYFTDTRGRHNESQYDSNPPQQPVFTNTSELYSIYCSYGPDNSPPELWNISTNPAQINPQDNIMIWANASDNVSGINTVKVNITYPNSTIGSFMMNHVVNSTYQYIFNDTQQPGQYNYIIYAVDNASNSNTSSQYSFSVNYLFGYTTAGNNSQNLSNRITGSTFTINDYASADNITAYIQVKGFTAPAPRYKCMIYRLNDSTLVGTTEEIIPGGIIPLIVVPNAQWVTFNFTGTKPTLVKNTTYILTCWGNNTKAALYYNTCTDTRGRYNITTYGAPPNQPVFTNETRLYSIYCRYTPDTTPPDIWNVSANPSSAKPGENVTIRANTSDNISGINIVKVNVTYPNGSYGNFTMNLTIGTQYQYVFNGTQQTGTYYYTVWATDKANNTRGSSGYSFRVT